MPGDPSRRKSLIVAIAAAAILLVFTTDIFRSQVQAAPGNEYVDAQICAQCHRQIAEDYSKTGMGRSLFRPSPANTVEDYTKNHEFYHSTSDTHYSMIERGGGYYQRRWQIGFGGKDSI